MGYSPLYHSDDTCQGHESRRVRGARARASSTAHRHGAERPAAGAREREGRPRRHCRGRAAKLTRRLASGIGRRGGGGEVWPATCGGRRRRLQALRSQLRGRRVCASAGRGGYRRFSSSVIWQMTSEPFATGRASMRASPAGVPRRRHGPRPSRRPLPASGHTHCASFGHLPRLPSASRRTSDRRRPPRRAGSARRGGREGPAGGAEVDPRSAHRAVSAGRGPSSDPRGAVGHGRRSDADRRKNACEITDLAQ